MFRLEIKAEKLANRCEICHQKDLYDPTVNYCGRCDNLLAENITKNLVLVKKEDRYSSWIRKIANIVSFASEGIVGSLILGLLFLIVPLCFLGSDSFSSHNKKTINTSNIPRISEQSLRFPQNYIPSPNEIPKISRCFQQPLVDLKDISRPLVRYYKFLTEVKKLGLKPPKEMLGGTKLFKAKDVIQFTFKDTNTAVLIAYYDTSENQVLAGDTIRKFNIDGRKALDVGNYSLLVKWGDEKTYQTLIDSLTDFENAKY